ncbi:hypothetical protein L1049_021554 [Liquidambar formosana]|uniref:NAC100 n=1 Tax=Liquidambar formosana TaxID=63359 RepID=A0A8T8BDW2_LIQFO|nr:NAC100 [Liquidambar formosana]
MENISGLSIYDDQIDLPPGFRFFPTDEELITHYLYRRVHDDGFHAIAIGEADLNKCEPWDLPRKAKMGEKPWYFFCLRDKKYPTGLRTNRATLAGYWKATGKDKEIYRGKSLVGMKKTLVFYRGRAPKGDKTNWVMHEYRLEGKFSPLNLPQTAKSEWVICRVFQKSSGGKKTHLPGLVRLSSFENELGPSGLPPLMDSSPSGGKTKPAVFESAYVPCFSNSMNGPRDQQNMIDHFKNPLVAVSSNPPDIFPRMTPSSSNYSVQAAMFPGNLQFQASLAMTDQTFLRTLIENQGSNMRQHFKTDRDMITVSQETGVSADMNTEISSVVSNLEMGKRPYEGHEGPSSSVGPLDFDYFLNY